MLVLLCTLALGILVFVYPVQKPVPPGVDASSYIYGARWITEHQQIPLPGQPTYQGLRAYTAPITDINLSILHQLSGLDLTFPLFSYYQLGLVLLLLLSSYLVGQMYGGYVSLLYPLFVLGSFAVIRLFIGSTVANLLAFSFINVLYYLSLSYQRRRRSGLLWIGGLLLVALFMTHNYLSAPITLTVFVLYVAVVLTFQPALRHQLTRRIRAMPVWGKLSTLVTIVILGIFAVNKYLPVVNEARQAFWHTTPGKFMNVIAVSQYPVYLGPTVFTIGVIGMLLFVFHRPRVVFGAQAFPLLWMVVLSALLQAYRLGVTFFYERIVFLGGMFIALFAAYALSRVIKNQHRAPRSVATIVALVVILVITEGITQVKSLYDKSNLITQSQLTALRVIKTTVPADAVIYSNYNALSQTAHDVLMSDHGIAHVGTNPSKCAGDALCQSFTSPTRTESDSYFRQHDMRYFLFLKPSVDGNEILTRLERNYQTSGKFDTLFQSADAVLLRIR